MHTSRTSILLVFTLFLKLDYLRAAEPNWSVDMAFAGACCCDPVCPCIFNSAPTHGHCKVNNLFVIKRGHYDKVSLDGLSIVTTEEMGEWRRFYIDEEASSEQVGAVVKLFEVIPESVGKVTEVKSVEKVPITVKWEEAHIRFSTPHSNVEMEPMKGEGGKPITIENVPDLEDYVQFKTRIHKYIGHDLEFEFSGSHASTVQIRRESDKSSEVSGNP